MPATQTIGLVPPRLRRRRRRATGGGVPRGHVVRGRRRHPADRLDGRVGRGRRRPLRATPATAAAAAAAGPRHAVGARRLESVGHRGRRGEAVDRHRWRSALRSIAASSGGIAGPERCRIGTRSATAARRATRGGAVALPRPVAGQHLEQDDAERVDVGRGGRRLAARLLRAEVVDRARGSCPGSVIWASATARAMPKSATFTRPSRPMRMLPGFTSRWTMPARVGRGEGRATAGRDAGAPGAAAAPRCGAGSSRGPRRRRTP